MSKKNITITAAVIAGIVLLLLLPISVPMSINVPCKINPAKIWIVQLGNDGNVATTLYNSLSGSMDNYFSAVPERGDSYVFKLTKNPSANWVEKGDTIGIIRSNLLSQQLAALNGRLKTSRSNLNVLMTGEKESLIKQARQQLNAAIENAEYSKKLFDRKKELFDKDLISYEENELYRTQAKQAEIDVAAKRAYLESIETGGKQEQINLVRNEINAIEQELNVVHDKIKSFIIVTPIEGNVNSYNSADTVLTVSSSDNVLFIPIAWRYHTLLVEGMDVSLNIPGGENVNYSVSRITNDIQRFNNEQVLTLIATTKEKDIFLPENLWTTCSLYFGDVSLWEFIKWKLSQTYEV
jgi:hypothetical protein